jgi:hypothetical protein
MRRLLFLCLLAVLPLAEAAAANPSPKPAVVPSAPLTIRLPFVPGKAYLVSQGNCGTLSHQNEFNRFAWDFAMPEGTPVAAAKIGRVVEIKQDSSLGGASEEFMFQRNYVLIDHGNGIFSQYVHLQRNSVPVKVGDLVKTGQVIGLSGKTGWSQGPHLHFQLVDLRGISQPARFFEFAAAGGVPERGAACEAVTENFFRPSDGRRSASTHEKYPGDSTIPSAAFRENEIELASALPARVYYAGETYTVSGSAKSPRIRTVQVVVTPRLDPAKILKTFTAEPDKKGRFTLSFSLEQPAEKWEIHPHAYALKIITLGKNLVLDRSASVPIGIYPR